MNRCPPLNRYTVISSSDMILFMPRMKIEEFRIEDYDAVLKLWKDTGLINRPGDSLSDIRLKLTRDPDLFLIASDGGSIIGCVIGGWDGRRGWIYHLAISPSHRRRGIARALMLELEARLARKGAKKVNAQIYRSNLESQRFFAGCGYETHSDLIMVGKNLVP